MALLQLLLSEVIPEEAKENRGGSTQGPDREDIQGRRLKDAIQIKRFARTLTRRLHTGEAVTSRERESTKPKSSSALCQNS